MKTTSAHMKRPTVRWYVKNAEKLSWKTNSRYKTGRLNGQPLVIRIRSYKPLIKMGRRYS